MSFKRKLIVIFLILLTAYIVWFFYVIEHPEIMYSDNIKIGNEIIKKIKAYKRMYGKLPLKLDDIGVKETMEGPIFYKKMTENSYYIYFGMRLGESYIYHSSNGKWHVSG